jgi:hypothetical protein
VTNAESLRVDSVIFYFTYLLIAILSIALIPMVSLAILSKGLSDRGNSSGRVPLSGARVARAIHFGLPDSSSAVGKV